ncbi:hypothetical protein L3V82_06280 [Thiotrichales bacterium 19S3-7]|nr:hypothetical protein [Thiotrichales bacterium 19S3-7]MCF6801703.1 hypothetical protein [Thiotrichales bacterium 19S3-11]
MLSVHANEEHTSQEEKLVEQFTERELRLANTLLQTILQTAIEGKFEMKSLTPTNSDDLKSTGNIFYTTARAVGKSITNIFGTGK